MRVVDRGIFVIALRAPRASIRRRKQARYRAPLTALSFLARNEPNRNTDTKVTNTRTNTHSVQTPAGTPSDAPFRPSSSTARARGEARRTRRPARAGMTEGNSSEDDRSLFFRRCFRRFAGAARCAQSRNPNPDWRAPTGCPAGGRLTLHTAPVADAVHEPCV
jgi:hypothetical protein